MAQVNWLPPTTPLLSHSLCAQRLELLHLTAKEAPHGDLQKSVGRGDVGEDETHLPLQAMDDGS
jgi:hypothetical protein